MPTKLERRQRRQRRHARTHQTPAASPDPQLAIQDLGFGDLAHPQQTPAAPVDLALDPRVFGYVHMDQDSTIRFTRETHPAESRLHTAGLNGCTALVVITAHARAHEIRMLHTPWPAVYMPVLLAALLSPDTRMVVIKTPAATGSISSDVQNALDNHARVPVVVIPYNPGNNWLSFSNASLARLDISNASLAVSAAATDQGFYVNFADNDGHQHVRYVEHRPLATAVDRAAAAEVTDRAFADYIAADTTQTPQVAARTRAIYGRSARVISAAPAFAPPQGHTPDVSASALQALIAYQDGHGRTPSLSTATDQPLWDYQYGHWGAPLSTATWPTDMP